MAVVINIIKNNEKVMLWLFREDLTISWLAGKLQQTKQAVSKKIKTNGFTDRDLTRIKQLGCNL